ncbi:right-handed parallel beta-helix repeat-containing protein [Psychrobacillus sp. NPDC096623]|uniref:right-handed parallel beta-helix repeat-containing protein n=1 Tax=Psychrobacillus sp. NPDC096623 TaxID=3364492 RepID=UPI00382B29DB
MEKDIYFVSLTGNDGNDGSIGAPWRTIQKAANELEAGETVFVRGGIYSETIKITNSGSKEKGYIIFQAFPQEKVILDGESISFKSGNKAMFHLENIEYLKIIGFELRNLIVNSSEKYPAGILVSGTGSNIHLVGNNIHHIENRAKKGNAHGILFYGNDQKGIANIVINQNNIHHLTLGWSEALTLSGNIEGFTITQNDIHHNNNIGIDVAGYYNACEDKCSDQARKGFIAHNRVYQNSSGNNPAYEGSFAAGGIYADGSTNITIENNLVYENDFGIELASENFLKNTSFIIVKNNVIVNNNGAGLIMGGSTKVNGGAYKNFIFNNIFKHNDIRREGYGEITVQNNVSNNEFTNNYIYISPGQIAIQQGHNGINNVFKNNRVYQINKQTRTPNSIENRINKLVKDIEK